ncbi:inovirus-type Gp2 protein [Dechloromonas sp. CZR5]|uniref:inovirus-type Gp2 protein n=1 Tax=Dechloromonas sp. CZR5 TaxID=2608630 RepID=UPI00123D2DC2|nr:inovirus-type Gp2 protein [Dechloromonas sp. CZR5]
MTIENQPIPTSYGTTNPILSAIDTHNMEPLQTISKLSSPSAHRSYREPLWDIFEFVRQVLSKEAPGFRIFVKKNGDKRIEALALGERFYRLMNNFMARIPESTDPAGFVGLFRDCCIELKLYYNPFGKAGDYHRPGADGKDMNGAELFNDLLELIRKRAQHDKRCKNYLNFAEDYDLDELRNVVAYFDDLFVDYSKILVVRVDLGYQACEADKISFERAHRDIQRFINYRQWHTCFKHCIGYVIGRERGTSSNTENGGNGRGYHFHCFMLFNGQKEKNDVELAKQIIDYWQTRIVNSRRTPADARTQTWFCNCNLGHYRHNGIGMVQHSDELKRWHMISALIYLTKRSQSLGDDVPPGTRALTKGQHKPRALETRGRPRQYMIQGKKVSIQRRDHSSGDFLQAGTMLLTSTLPFTSGEPPRILPSCLS